jgi:hypothetical protein
VPRAFHPPSKIIQRPAVERHRSAQPSLTFVLVQVEKGKTARAFPWAEVVPAELALPSEGKGITHLAWAPSAPHSDEILLPAPLRQALPPRRIPPYAASLQRRPPLGADRSLRPAVTISALRGRLPYVTTTEGTLGGRPRLAVAVAAVFCRAPSRPEVHGGSRRRSPPSLSLCRSWTQRRRPGRQARPQELRERDLLLSERRARFWPVREG